MIYTIEMTFSMSFKYALGRFMFEIHRNRIGDDVIVTSFNFSLKKCIYLKFY